MKRRISWQIDGEVFELKTYSNAKHKEACKILGMLRDKGVLEEYFVEVLK